MKAAHCILGLLAGVVVVACSSAKNDAARTAGVTGTSPFATGAAQAGFGVSGTGALPGTVGTTGSSGVGTPPVLAGAGSGVSDMGLVGAAGNVGATGVAGTVATAGTGLGTAGASGGGGTAIVAGASGMGTSGSGASGSGASGSGASGSGGSGSGASGSGASGSGASGSGAPSNGSNLTGTLGALGAVKPIMNGWATTNGLETLIYLSSAPLTCEMMAQMGVKWLRMLPAGTQVIEIVVMANPSAQTYSIGGPAAFGAAEVNYAEGSKSSATEVTGSAGSVTLTKTAAMGVMEGTLSVTAPYMLSGSFHADWCQGGTEY